METEGEPSIEERIDLLLQSVHNVDTSTGCEGFEQAYNAAAQELQAATAALQDALNDLYDCQQGGGQRPTESLEDLMDRTVSILD